MEIDLPTGTLRESADDEENGSAAENPVEETKVAPEVSEPETTANEEIEETSTNPTDFAAQLEEEWSKDPLKKAVLDKLIDRAAKKMKDEWAGARYGWLPNDVAKKYVGKPDVFKDDLRKAEEYDKLKSEVESLRQKEGTPNTPPPKQPSVAETAAAKAKAFVEKNNIDPDQLPVLSALFAEIALEKEAVKEEVKKSVIPDTIRQTAWEQEKGWAESQDDYRSDRRVRALAHQIAYEDKVGPKDALLRARQELGISQKKTIISQGSPKQGTPAMSKSASPGKAGDVDIPAGMDPLEWLKQKLRKEK